MCQGLITLGTEAARDALPRELGMKQTDLGVDTQNTTGALRLYESMGYQVVTKSNTYRKPLLGGR
jgi:ribosomal protein S18 acetylase RimI-like enzyme